jgi:hypothetical protein
MGMPDTVRRYTVDQVLAFPADGNRYELVAGELLVTPAPRRGINSSWRDWWPPWVPTSRGIRMWQPFS